jgi:hypothetical protein
MDRRMGGVLILKAKRKPAKIKDEDNKKKR